MNATIQQMKDWCDYRIRCGDFYVWGGSGQLATKITESWIRQKEAACNGGVNAENAILFWRTVLQGGHTNARAYDCSGFVSGALIDLGLRAKRTDCDGLWANCASIGQPEDGALLFRVSDKNSEDETHVGIYFDGYAYHAKGRSYGVVREPYKASYWHKIGWYAGLPREGGAISTPAPVEAIGGNGDTVLVQYRDNGEVQRVNIRNSDGRNEKKKPTGKVIGVAKSGAYYPLIAKASNGFYQIDFEDADKAFISTAYTVIV